VDVHIAGCARRWSRSRATADPDGAGIRLPFFHAGRVTGAGRHDLVAARLATPRLDVAALLMAALVGAIFDHALLSSR